MINFDKEKKVFQLEGDDSTVLFEIADAISAWMLKRKWEDKIPLKASQDDISYVVSFYLAGFYRELGEFL